jgi:hypothetical protein
MRGLIDRQLCPDHSREVEQERIVGHPYPESVIRISCEACGWVAITSQPVNDVWREHEAGCPALGGAVRHLPDLPPLRRLLPPVNRCHHRLVRRQIAISAAGVKKYAVMCDLCGRLVG